VKGEEDREREKRNDEILRKGVRGLSI